MVESERGEKLTLLVIWPFISSRPRGCHDEFLTLLDLPSQRLVLIVLLPLLLPLSLTLPLGVSRWGTSQLPRYVLLNPLRLLPQHLPRFVLSRIRCLLICKGEVRLEGAGDRKPFGIVGEDWCWVGFGRGGGHKGRVNGDVDDLK